MDITASLLTPEIIGEPTSVSCGRGQYAVQRHFQGHDDAFVFVFDRQNYSSWASVYLVDMLILDESSPEVYAEFIKRGCSVTQTKQKLNSVWPEISGIVGISQHEIVENVCF